MGHAPSATARLSLRRDGESFVRDAAMTKENRQAAWKYNQGDDDTPARPPGKPAADGRVDTLPSAEHAALLGRHIDAIWDQAPRSGTAKVRVLFQQDGRPFAGKVSVHGEFLFRARGRIAYHQGLNPNANGRWLHDELAPDTYDLEIEGTGRFDGFTWTRETSALGAGDVVTYTIDLDPGAPGD